MLLGRICDATACGLGLFLFRYDRYGLNGVGILQSSCPDPGMYVTKIKIGLLKLTGGKKMRSYYRTLAKAASLLEFQTPKNCRISGVSREVPAGPCNTVVALLAHTSSCFVDMMLSVCMPTVRHPHHTWESDLSSVMLTFIL